MTLTRTEQRQVERLVARVQRAVAKLPQHPWHHGYLHGVVTLNRQGKELRVKACLGGFNPVDWEAVMAAANSVPGVHATHFNLD